MTLMLVSPAGRYIVRQTLIVDGGLSSAGPARHQRGEPVILLETPIAAHDGPSFEVSEEQRMLRATRRAATSQRSVRRTRACARRSGPAHG